MTDMLLNAAGDLDDSFSLVTSAQQLIKQQVLIILRTNYEEWKFNLDIGLPWITNSFGSRQIFEKGSRSFSDASIRATLLEIDGVEDILELSSSVSAEKREYSVEMKLKIFDGSLLNIKEEIVI